MAEALSPKLQRVMERAKRDPEERFLSLAHLIDVPALRRAYEGLNKKASVGVDGVTHEAYGEGLAGKLEDLHGRLKSKRYRHQPIRRVQIPKEKGKTRPIGISTVEDKVVQAAIREVLEAVYEPIFHGHSYGFRRGRSAHDAMRTLDRILNAGEGNWVLEADIQSFFDSIDRKMLMEMLRNRVADTSLLRLVGKCLRVGILEGEVYTEPNEGTVQGSVLSPLLGNIYLHHVLDLWFERVVLPRLKGKAHLVRYADDFVICFEREEDARRVMKVVHSRFERHGLKLHPEKTRLVNFRRPPRGPKGTKGQDTFDFLGFTVYWRRTKKGGWRPGMKTRRARLSRAIKAIADYCRSQRGRPVKQQHRGLTARMRGHFNYFGVNGNMSSLSTLLFHAERSWFKWLNRRSQRASKTWPQFRDLMRDFPLPKARVYVQLWST